MPEHKILVKMVIESETRHDAARLAVNVAERFDPSPESRLLSWHIIDAQTLGEQDVIRRAALAYLHGEDEASDSALRALAAALGEDPNDVEALDGAAPQAEPLLVERYDYDADGDAYYVGDLDAGKAYVKRDRWAKVETNQHGGVMVTLHDDEALTSAAEWGSGATEEEAWRYALAAAMGPLDEVYDEAALRAELARVAPQAPESAAARSTDAGEYATAPTHLRVYEEEPGEEHPWWVDAADDTGRATEDWRTFDTREEAIREGRALLPRDNPGLDWSRFNPMDVRSPGDSNWHAEVQS